MDMKWEESVIRSFIRITLLSSLGILSLNGLSAADGQPCPAPFSNASFSGTYLVSFDGDIRGGLEAITGESLAPLNVVGSITADGNGHFQGSGTANILFNTNGIATTSPTCSSGGGEGGDPSNCDAICPEQVVGTYAINADGTGTATETVTPTQTGSQTESWPQNSDPRCGPAGGFTTTTSIVLSSPDHIAFVGTDPRATIRGTATKQQSTQECGD
jgi:hypothetical protein